jgi:Family of unknown function (DUF6632)
MSDTNRLLLLRIALVVIGLTFIFGIYTLGILWPSGWVWGQGYSHYLMMIIGVYATLGVFLLIAARNPYAHKSLIWFTVWSSVVHGAIMGVQGLMDTTERGHLVGDAPALVLVAIILAVLMPRTATHASVDAADRASLTVSGCPLWPLADIPFERTDVRFRG